MFGRRLLPRVVGFSLLALVLVPAIYYSTQYVNAITLYPGDVLEQRDCRWCNGTGKDEDIAAQIPTMGDRCVGCRGTGKVQVVVPGPQRPTRVHGAVRLLFGEEDEFYEQPEDTPMASNSRLLMPQRGGIEQASVAFIRANSASNEPVTLMTNHHGRFFAFLPPGTYSVRVVATGYEPFEDQLEIPPLTEPIWFEHAHIYLEPETPEQQQSWYGVVYTAKLEGR
ncbi:MAG: carboxypeptidase-like regulatory domain-containing protein [Planctomycetota bacterium]